ncbi:FAR-17a/AIG1-like protein [Spraguea lophii 42_110]|uniref:FAR-17a/AIG1-like protein n=1 Tax=Spraguea lophii (strain 42_110) TaxID=1358809 RepID=S7W9G7_SPRLO|nr:FAR-17a/AIG1-like protein [Spraguea lophii 42_110]
MENKSNFVNKKTMAHNPMFTEIIRIICISLFVHDILGYNLSKHFKTYFSSIFGGRSMYFTVFSLGMTIIALSTGIISRITKHKKLKSVYEICLVVAFTAETIVTVTFWPLYIFKQDLLYSDVLSKKEMIDKIYTDIIQHILPFIVLIFEICIIPLKINIKQKTFAFVYSTSYMLWAHYLASRNNIWAYPLLKKITSLFRMLLATTLTMIGLIICEYLCIFVNRIHFKKRSSKQKKM